MEANTQPDLRVDTATQIEILMFKHKVQEVDDRDTMPTIFLPSKRRRLTDDDPTPVIRVRPILYPW